MGWCRTHFRRCCFYCVPLFLGGLLLASAAAQEKDEPSPPALVERLAQAHAREETVDALASLGKEAVPALLKGLEHENRDVRVWSAVTLGRIRDPRVVDGLARSLAAGGERLRLAAVKSLGQAGFSAGVPPLLRGLKDETPPVRAAAAESLGHLGAKEGIAGLVKALDDPAYTVRYSACRALGWITGLAFGEDKAQWKAWHGEREKKLDLIRRVEAALDGLDSPDDRRREQAKKDLLVLGPSTALEVLEPYFLAKIDSPRTAAVEAVEHIAHKTRGEVFDRAVGLLCIRFRKMKQVELTFAAFHQFGPRVLPALIHNMGSWNTWKVDAWDGLVDRFGKASLDVLVPALFQEEGKALFMVQRTLQRIGTPALARLLDTLLTSRPEEVGILVNTCGIFRRDTVEVAFQRLRKGGRQGEERMAELFEHLREESLAFLLPRVATGKTEEAVLAIRMLGRMGACGAVYSIRRTLTAPEPAVRRQALLSLGLLGDRRVLDSMLALDRPASAAEREQVAEALGAMGDAKVVPVLQEYLQDSSVEVRKEAARSLARMGAASSARALAECFQKERGQGAGPDALRALAVLGQAESTPLFAAVWKGEKDEALRLWAACGLARLKGDEACLAYLHEVASTRKHRCRGASVEALGRIGGAPVVAKLMVLLEADSALAKSCARALAGLGRPALDKTIERIRKCWPLRWRRGLIHPLLLVMIESARQGPHRLAHLLDHSDENIRLLALSSLSRYPRPSCVPLFAKALEHKSLSMRRLAISGLGATRSVTAVEPLLAFAEETRSAWQYPIARSLGQIGAPALPALYRALKSEKLWTASTAAWALGEVGEEQAVPALIDVLPEDLSFVPERARLIPLYNAALHALHLITKQNFGRYQTPWREWVAKGMPKGSRKGR